MTLKLQVRGPVGPDRSNTAALLGPLVRVRVRKLVPPGALLSTTLTGQLLAAHAYELNPSGAVSVIDAGATALAALAVMVGTPIAGFVTCGRGRSVLTGRGDEHSEIAAKAASAVQHLQATLCRARAARQACGVLPAECTRHALGRQEVSHACA